MDKWYAHLSIKDKGTNLRSLYQLAIAIVMLHNKSPQNSVTQKKIHLFLLIGPEIVWDGLCHVNSSKGTGEALFMEM